MTATRRRLLLAVVLAAATALRLWGLAQGLPHATTRPDEREVLEHTAGFAAGDPDPHWFIYPSLYLYVVWLGQAAMLAARRGPSYVTALQEQLPAMLLQGRALTAAVGVVSVGVAAAIARRAGGAAAGLVAATLLAGNFLHVRDSHWLKPDVLLGLGMLTSVWALAGVAERPTRGRIVLAGVAIGLTTAVKYNGVFLAVPAWAAGVIASPHRGVRRLVPGAATIGTLAVSAGVFLAVCPYLLLDLARTQGDATLLAYSIFASRPQTGPTAPGTAAAVWAFVKSRAFAYHALVSLRRGSGLALALAVPVALGVAVVRPRHPMLRLAAIFVVAYFGVIGGSPVHLARYFTPLVPLLVVMVAVTTVALVEAAVPVRARAATLVVATALLVAEPLARSVAYDRLVDRTDTRVLATEWMTTHLPAGARVVVLGGPVFPMGDPDLPPGVEKLNTLMPAAQYAAAGVTHVVTHWHHQLVAFSQLNPVHMAVLQPHLALLAEFSPFAGAPAGAFEPEDAYYVPFFAFDGVERPGPLVRIYAYTP